jgi:hypothetical protein
MYGLITALTVLVVLCFLMLGGVIGFMASKFYPPAPRLHPEMYNPDGSIKPDILYAVTFDQNYDDTDEDDDEEESNYS